MISGSEQLRNDWVQWDNLHSNCRLNEICQFHAKNNCQCSSISLNIYFDFLMGIVSFTGLLKQDNVYQFVIIAYSQPGNRQESLGCFLTSVIVIIEYFQIRTTRKKIASEFVHLFESCHRQTFSLNLPIAPLFYIETKNQQI